ncbi:hypothetical protein [Legionella hackeliae]|uniref:hypothetical protein n=1 Tax=Legionella hackeliae TaxID=449 RepID=UPI0012E3E483|nr:hypothetical protein [Legionella hackeliae]
MLLVIMESCKSAQDQSSYRLLASSRNDECCVVRTAAVGVEFVLPGEHSLYCS